MKPLFRRILVVLTSVSVASVVLTTAFLYFGFLRIAQQDAATADRDRLVQLENLASVMAVQARSLAEQVFSNEVIATNLIYTELEQGPWELIRALRMLETYRQPLSQVESIYIYNGSQKTYYVTAESIPTIVSRPLAPDNGVWGLLEQAGKVGQLRPIPRIIQRQNSLSKVPVDKKVYTFLYWGAAVIQDGVPQFALVINMDAGFIHAGLSELSKDMRNSAYAVNAEGVIVLENPLRPFLSVVTGDPEGSLVSRTHLSSLGWTFVQQTSVARLEAQLVPLRNTVAAVFLGVLLLTLALALIASRSLYAPIGSLEAALQALSETRAREHRELAESRLKRLLTSEGSPATDRWNETDLESEALCLVFLVVVEDFPTFRQRFTQADRSRIKAVIRDTCLRCLPTGVRGTGCEWDERGDLLVVQSLQRETLPEVSSLVARWSAEVSALANVTIGVTYDSQARLPEALAGTALRLAEGAQSRVWTPGAVVDVNRLEYADPATYAYPIRHETEILEHVRTGSHDKAAARFQGFVEGLRPYPPAVLHTSLVRLASSLHSQLEATLRLQRRSLSLRLPELMEQVTSFDSLAQLEGLFGELFTEYQALQDNRRSERRITLASEVDQLIQQYYTDPNLSRPSIADRLGYSAVYLGKVYLQETGRTIAQAISHHRLESARQLLATSTLSVTQIAHSVGFSNEKYFHPLFKKHQGVTPTEYRQQVLKQAL